MPVIEPDIVVVGAGNAAFSAALTAREMGCRVVMLECAPQEESGGNSRFTSGAFRFTYHGIEDLKAIIPDLSEDEIATTDFGTYTEDQFFDDMYRVTRYRTDPELCDRLVTRSFDAMVWLRSKGVRFVPIYGRQAFKVDGRFRFWGGLTIEASGGGPGLIGRLTDAALREGIGIRYNARALSLIHDGERVLGVRAKGISGVYEIHCAAVILACGGFEANSEWRARYLGPGWELAKVRGTQFNMGDGIGMALGIGAMPYGNWSGCHAVGWDFNAPEFGDLSVGDGFQKHSYPFGIMINADGRRFVDEGADFRNYTYAKYGGIILEQPDQFAWQIFDGKVIHLLRHEYKIKHVSKVSSNSLAELASKLESVNGPSFLAQVEEYNAAVRTDIPFNPNVKDGRCTEGLTIPKSNWANRIDDPPFEAYHVGCGITFTFGGLKLRSIERASSGYRSEANSWPIRRGGAGWRAFLLQLSGRYGPDLRGGVRPHGWARRGGRHPGSHGGGIMKERSAKLPAGAEAALAEPRRER